MRRLVPGSIASLHLAILCVWVLAVAGAAYAHDQEIEGGTDDVPTEEHLPCVEGSAGDYPCSNMDLVHFVPLAEFGALSANDIWGWTDPLTGFEYVILGLRNGAAFIHIDDHGHPTILGHLPTRTVESSWRDMKVYDNHVYVVSEAPGHGMQVFDLTRLRDVDLADAPITFAHDLAYLEFWSAHNIAINEDSGFAYAVGAASCNGGLHMIDLLDPKAPEFAGCFAEDRYTHDTQCVNYHGPDADYAGREICFSSNEDTVTIVDVTNKSAPVMLSRVGYIGSAYTHQGWLTEDHAYFLLDDEFDEVRYNTFTRTLVWDTSDLDAPFVSGFHIGDSRSIDHNQYIRGNHVFQANYRHGIRILRLGDLSEGEMTEVAYFDTQPADDLPSFSGTWSVYPFFESGYVVASDINRGLYILWPRLDAVPECGDGIDNDGDGLRDYPEDPTCIHAEASSEGNRFDVELALYPHHTRRSIGPSKRRSLNAAILGSPTVDVTRIELDSLVVHPGGAVPKPMPRRRWAGRGDVNRDGHRDLALKVRVARTALAHEESSVCISGLLAGDPFEACATTIVRKTKPAERAH